jgi:GNAT superfamily N-acetyltransferase
MPSQPDPRRASPGDRETLTSIITIAFAGDPLWSHALSRVDGRTDHHARFWEIFVDGALPYRWVWLAGEGQALSMWIPPGGTELTEEQESRLVALAHESLGTKVGDYLELLHRFEAAHPRDTPHYYLSFLATHPNHRGKGVGMELLARNLEVIDGEGLPAYLESSNPANNARYESVGFVPVGAFAYPGGGPTVTTMWREPRSAPVS